MKSLLILLFSLPFWNNFQETAMINSMQESASAAYQGKDYRKAITLYEELIKDHHSTDIRIYHNLGTAYFRILQYKQAEKVFRKIISMNVAPYNSYCYNNLGIIYFRSGQYDKARQHFKQALSLYSANAEARFNYEAVTLTILKNKPFMSNEGRDKKSKLSQSSLHQQQNPDEQSTAMSRSNKPGTQNSPSSQKSKGGSGQGKGPEDALTTKRLQQMNINPQHAQYILELQRQREIQYIHQQKESNKSDEQPAYPNW